MIKMDVTQHQLQPISFYSIKMFYDRKLNLSHNRLKSLPTGLFNLKELR